MRRRERYPSTAQQKEQFRRYLRSRIGDAALVRLDSLVSFLVVAVSATFLAFIFYYENITMSPGIGAIKAASGFIGITMSGIIWTIYKYAQYEEQIDTRLIAVALMAIFLNSFVWAGAVVLSAHLMAVSLLVIPVTDEIRVTILAPTMGLFVFFIGIYCGWREGRDKGYKGIARNLLLGPNTFGIDNCCEGKSQQKRLLETQVVSYLSLDSSRLYWTVLFTTLNFNLFLGIVRGVVGVSAPLSGLFGQPYISALAIAAVVITLTRLLRAHRKIVLTVAAADDVSSTSATDVTGNPTS